MGAEAKSGALAAAWRTGLEPSGGRQNSVAPPDRAG